MGHLDENGRCCGRRPLLYKRPRPHYFCARCDRQFDPETNRQVANWAWKARGDGFVRRAALADGEASNAG